MSNIRQKILDNLKEDWLDTQYDSAQSFYKKARIEEDGNKLYSYDTLVAEIKDGKPIIYNAQSQTTRRHIREFLLQKGFDYDEIYKAIDDFKKENGGYKPKVEESLKEDYPFTHDVTIYYGTNEDGSPDTGEIEIFVDNRDKFPDITDEEIHDAFKESNLDIWFNDITARHEMFDINMGNGYWLMYKGCEDSGTKPHFVIEKDLEESTDMEDIWGAVCGTETPDRKAYIDKYFTNHDLNKRYNRLGRDHSLIMGALRNGNYNVVKQLMDHGETIIDDEKEEFDKLIKKQKVKESAKPDKDKKPTKRLVMNQGNVYIFEQTKGSKKSYIVGEDIDKDANTIEKVNKYNNQDEAFTDFFARVGIDPNNELKESLKNATKSGNLKESEITYSYTLSLPGCVPCAYTSDWDEETAKKEYLENEGSGTDYTVDDIQVEYEEFTTVIKEADTYIYSNAESEDKSDAESYVDIYSKEYPKLKFNISKDSNGMYFVNFIGRYQDICDALINLGWYNEEEINQMTKDNLIKKLDESYKIYQQVENNGEIESVEVDEVESAEQAAERVSEVEAETGCGAYSKEVKEEVIKESGTLWTSEVTEDDYDKEDLKANEYQDYLNEFGGEDTEFDKPMEFEEWFDKYMADDAEFMWDIHNEDLKENILPMIDKQVNGAIFITGDYNSNYPDFRKSGPGGKIVRDGDDLVDWLSEEDRVDITYGDNEQLGIAGYDHDGSIHGYLYTLPDDPHKILEIALSTNYYDKNDYEDNNEIIEEFLEDLRNDNVWMRDVKAVDLLVPIVNGFRTGIMESNLKESDDYPGEYIEPSKIYTLDDLNKMEVGYPVAVELKSTVKNVNGETVERPPIVKTALFSGIKDDKYYFYDGTGFSGLFAFSPNYIENSGNVRITDGVDIYEITRLVEEMKKSEE